jgi:hypothetical protein
MSNDGKHFHSDSKQHVLNGVYDKNNRNLRITVAPDPPFRPSDIVANVSPLEIALDSFPLPLDPYPIAVLYAVDNDINDSFEYSIVNNPSGLFKLVKNPGEGTNNILCVTSDVEQLGLVSGDQLPVTIRVCDIFGLCYEKVIVVDVVNTASVDGPTDIEFSSREVTNNSQAGTFVCKLTALNGTPGYVYSIADDPDSKFSISGDSLLLASGVSRSNSIRHSVTVRVTDANLVSFTKRMTISVSQLADSDTALAPLLNVSLYNSPVLVAGEKNTFSLQEGVKKLIIKVKAQTHISVITYAFSEADYDNGNTHTISEGQTLVLENLYLKGKEIFFSSDKNTSVVEIQQWF